MDGIRLLLAIIICHRVGCFNFEANNLVIHRPSYSRNANFGFSVAGYKVDNEQWIIIGAPLTLRNRSWINSREGAVYRCHPSSPNNCHMLPFDKKGLSSVISLSPIQVLAYFVC